MTDLIFELFPGIVILSLAIPILMFFNNDKMNEKQKEIFDLVKDVDVDFEISDNGSLSSIKNPKNFKYATDIINKQKNNKR